MSFFKSKLFLIPICFVTVVFVAVTGLFLLKPDPTSTDSALSENDSSSVTATVSFPSPKAFLEEFDTGGLSLFSTARNGYFYLRRDEKWTCTFLKGVNMGLTLPDTDLNNPNIPYATYYEWFSLISQMNANTIKVFTIMNPDFYRAFYDYNTAHSDEPLFLFQGIWISEDEVTRIGDAYAENGKLLTSFTRSVQECLDVIHGKSDYTSYGDIKKAIYDKDVSPYVAGYILGLEWQPDFILTTNANNPNKSAYTGRYLYTSGSSPFEAFLCQVGDTLISYETEQYHTQSPIAFLNWSTTDPLIHSNEPFPEEDSAQLNTNSIKSTEYYHCGMFAALDIYPYYPEFLNVQKEYVDYRDETGRKNSYRAYLSDLKKHYSIPMVVAEFGVPSSRGRAHSSVMGYHQGMLTEEEQGTINRNMLYDIAKEGYGGAMLFSWQDEWFKQVWNNIKYAPDKASHRSLNVMSAEQGYGLLGFQPNQAGLVYPDGDLSEWSGDSPVFSSLVLDLYCKADEGYLHIMGKLKNGNLSRERFAVALGLTGNGSLSAKDYGLRFERPADFLLIVDGKNNTRLLTEAHYDAFYYQYSVIKSIFARKESYEKINTGFFSPIRTFLSNEIVLPVDKKTIPPSSYESGKLVFGNANPNRSDYHSLSDFYFTETAFEVRIPWYLLNIMNPAEKTKLANFYVNKQLTFDHFETFFIGGGRIVDDAFFSLAPYSYSGWEQSLYQTRLKKSYSLLKEAFAEVMPDYR